MPLSYSQIKDVSYNPSTQTLTLTLKNGDEHHYSPVSPENGNELVRLFREKKMGEFNSLLAEVTRELTPGIEPYTGR